MQQVPYPSLLGIALLKCRTIFHILVVDAMNLGSPLRDGLTRIEALIVYDLRIAPA
jgi:hypothetical protein